MADVFISYKSERRAAARHLARILACYGYTVWFDHALVAGGDYEAQIEQEIVAAKAVVVLWCSLSVASEPVRSEANWAKGRGKLIPVVIEPCSLPLFSTLTQNIDVSGADCSPRDYAFDPLLSEIERLVGWAPQADFKALQTLDADWRAAGSLRFAQFPRLTKTTPQRVVRLEQPASIQIENEVPDLVRRTGASLASPSSPRSTPLASAGVDDRTIEHTFWQSVKDATDAAEFIAFLEKYPSGTFAALAFERGKTAIDAIKSSPVLRRLLSRYPQSKLTERVRKRLAEREWDTVRKSREPRDIENFATEFDGLPQAAEARVLVAKLAAKAAPGSSRVMLGKVPMALVAGLFAIVATFAYLLGFPLPGSTDCRSKSAFGAREVPSTTGYIDKYGCRHD